MWSRVADGQMATLLRQVRQGQAFTLLGGLLSGQGCPSPAVSLESLLKGRSPDSECLSGLPGILLVPPGAGGGLPPIPDGQRHPGALCPPTSGSVACAMELERSEDFIWHTWFYVRHRGLVRQGHLHVIDGRVTENGRTWKRKVKQHLGYSKEKCGDVGCVHSCSAKRGCKWVAPGACSSSSG